MKSRMLKRAVLISGCLALAACGGGDPAPSDASAATSEASQDTSPILDYLPWDASAPEVQTTESGLQYRIIREGPEDGLSPRPQDRVDVMYEGRLPDGTVFDSSYERGAPSSFGVNAVISGWTEGLQLMSVGDEFIFYIPNSLAYRNQARGDVIKAGDDLVFRVELLGVDQPPPPRTPDDEAWSSYTPWSSDNPGVQRTESGLEYIVLKAAEEELPSPKGNELLVLYYEGRIDETGETFDSAFDRGEPIITPFGELLPGMNEALGLMQPGDRWLVHLPPELAFGSEGFRDIPPNTAITFELDLMDVIPQN